MSPDKHPMACLSARIRRMRSNLFLIMPAFLFPDPGHDFPILPSFSYSFSNYFLFTLQHLVHLVLLPCNSFLFPYTTVDCYSLQPHLSCQSVVGSQRSVAGHTDHHPTKRAPSSFSTWETPSPTSTPPSCLLTISTARHASPMPKTSCALYPTFFNSPFPFSATRSDSTIVAQKLLMQQFKSLKMVHSRCNISKHSTVRVELFMIAKFLQHHPRDRYSRLGLC